MTPSLILFVAAHRHKTRKEPFRSRLVAIIMLQVLVLIAFATALLVTGSPEALWQLFTS